MKFSIEISPKEAKSIIAQVIEMYSASVVDKLEKAANNPESAELIQSILEACKNEKYSRYQTTADNSVRSPEEVIDYTAVLFDRLNKNHQ